MGIIEEVSRGTLCYLRNHGPSTVSEICEGMDYGQDQIAKQRVRVALNRMSDAALVETVGYRIEHGQAVKVWQSSTVDVSKD